ncbi:hypothetical protein NQ317_016600 [Molorchus minor]|uniref:Uncharacterized protein n=1 Tax=Molorchus minor TaxID=1323400 RepID=A0ABQ9J3A7_9CUCU|nr:hypothetical protein NQ317_016600 [Molorchus minor]
MCTYTLQPSNRRHSLVLDDVFLTNVVDKPPLKREDSFLQRFSTRQIPEAQETVEDTGSEGGTAEVEAQNSRPEIESDLP